MTLKSEQQRVFDWLGDDLGLPVFAGAYKGALICLANRPPGYITFVSHAGRDLMNRLAATVKGIESKLVDYQKHVDGIQGGWKDEWGANGFDAAAPAPTGHLIPYAVCVKVRNLIDDHKSGRLRSTGAEVLFFSTFLDYSDKDRIPSSSLADWSTARRWFKAHAHLRENDYPTSAASEVAAHFSTLQDFLTLAASSEYERMKGLHAIVEDANQ